MTDWTNGTCPRHSECSFYESTAASPLLRIKYATMYPYCRGGKHESCTRWFMMEAGRIVPEDLLPDGGKDLFATEQRHVQPVHSARVLVVDDMPLFRKSLVSMVGLAAGDGFSVVEASSAEEALRTLSDSPGGWRLVIVDYNMGAMTGYDLIVEMRAHPTLSGIPVVVFSSETDPAIREKCTSIPRVRWLDKKPSQAPFDEVWQTLVIEQKL